MTWTGKSAYAVGAVFSALIACSSGVHDHDNLREDVLYCEEAVSALNACCPGFRSSISCEYAYDYTPGGCDSSSTTTGSLPDLNLAQSRCIISTTCDVLIAKGICGAPKRVVCR